MQTLSMVKTLDLIEAAAATADQAVRMVPDDCPMGGVLRQGDVLYVRVPAGFAHGHALPKAERQVVPGQTQGSRHTVGPNARLYEGTTQPAVRRRDGTMVALVEAFLGACVETPVREIASHPEHAHLSLPAGVWQVVQQRDLRTQQRMAD